MKKKIIAGLLATTLLSSYCFASSDNDYLARRIFDASNQLEHIAETNSKDLCAGDVKIAQAYLASAGKLLRQDKEEGALVSLTYGQNELKEISFSRSYCQRLSPMVKPVLANVILLKSELENIRLKHKSH